MVINGNVIPLDTVAAGDTQQAIGPRNPPGVYSSTGAVLADEQSKLRTEFVRLATEGRPARFDFRAGAPTPITQLVGFVSSDAIHRLEGDAESHDQTLVRSPYVVQRSDVGSDVRIDPAFIALRNGSAGSSPFAGNSNSWTDATITGTWLLGLAAPRDIGRLRPTTVTLDLDARSVGFHITLRRAKCDSGQVRESSGGDIVAEWNGESARRRVTIELSPTDIDANGWAWLQLVVDPATGGGGLMGDTVGATWTFTRFDPTLTGKIDGPPQAEVRSWPIPEIPKPQPPRKPPAKPTTKNAKPATKPATKPAAKPVDKKPAEKK